MTLALLDCPTGLAGNMLLAALFDLGLPEPVVHDPLAALGLAGRYRLQIEERRSGGLRGLHLEVLSLESDPPHRSWHGLRRQLEEAVLAEPLRQQVLAVFGLLAEAEAAVHGHAPEAVHFHEVGALDALVDIVGVCAGLLHFGVERLICGVPPAGHGRVDTAHGLLPLPAPAVLEIARRRGIPLAGSETFPAAELTTPTGLALAACWSERFGPPPGCRPRQVGVGLGSRALDRPNLLRLILADAIEPPAVAVGDLVPEGLAAVASPAEAEQGGDGPAAMASGEQRQTLLQQQCQIDDASGEDLAFLMEALRRAGALEVFSQPISMKKGRPGVLITALTLPGRAEQLRQVWWRHSTTLGLREQLLQRWVLARRSERWPTSLGPVRIKRAWHAGGEARLKIEHDDLAALAQRHDLSLAELRRRLEEELQAVLEAGPEPAAPPDPGPAAAGGQRGD